MPEVFCVVEDERFIDVESASDYILRVLVPEPLVLFNGVVALMEELLIVGQLDNHWDIKCVLEPFSEDEGHQVPKMHEVIGRPSAGVEIERLPLFVLLKENFKISVREENSSSKEMVCSAVGYFFDPLN